MAATIGMIYRAVLEVLTDANGPATLLRLEKEGYVCDDTDTPHVKVFKEIDVAGRGEHLGVPMQGDRYTVTFASPTVTDYIDEAVDTVEEVVNKAGAQANLYEVSHGGGYIYYD